MSSSEDAQQAACEHKRIRNLLLNVSGLIDESPEQARLGLEDILRDFSFGWLTPGPAALDQLTRDRSRLDSVPPQLLGKWYRELEPLAQGQLIRLLVEYHGSVRRVSELMGLSSRRLEQILHVCRLGPEWHSMLKAGATEWKLRTAK